MAARQVVALVGELRGQAIAAFVTKRVDGAASDEDRHIQEPAMRLDDVKVTGRAARVRRGGGIALDNLSAA